MPTKFETLLPDVVSMVPACPEIIAERAIRAAVIELCEKTDAYQKQLDAVTVHKGIYEYDLEPPIGTNVHRIIWVTYDGKPLEPVSTGLLEQRQENWRKETGTPEYFVKDGLELFNLVPVPNEVKANAVEIRVSLKPTQSATSCDDLVMTDHRDTIINGALFRLCRMPSKDWTDLGAAQIYNSLFNEGLILAERRARQADNPVAAKVRYGGLHKGRKTRKYAGRKSFI